MTIDRAFDKILNTGSKVKIVRLFILKDKNFMASGRHIARLVGLTAPAAHAALKDLYKQDVLRREIIGKQHIYSLKENNTVVYQILKPIFQKEISIKVESKNYTNRHNQNKNLYIIAGANGSGKTIFAKEFLPDYAKCPHFVNSDLIARGLSPFSPQIAAMKAGRLVLEQIHDLADKNLDFGFETTLAGKSYINLFKDLKKRGYFLHLFFLWISTTELALARIKDRVADGGHNVPAVDVKRRFYRGIHNLFKLYRPLLDTWMLFNNSGSTPSLIAQEKKGELSVFDKDLFEKIAKKAG